MNVLGIDYQQTLSTLALRESVGVAATTTQIGDGRRIVIPHAVTEAGQWGSDALQMAEATCLQPLEPLRDGPWRDLPGAALYWQALYERFYGYLGRVRPDRAHGYQAVVALQASDWEGARDAVRGLCAQAGARRHDTAGLREAVFIPATEALLCRRLAAPADFAPLHPDDTVKAASRDAWTIAVVAVGDTSTLVGAYRIRRGESGVGRIDARPDALLSIPTGLGVWQARLLDEVCGRFREECELGHILGLRDAALDFARQIAQSPSDAEHTWHGTGRSQMHAPLHLTRAECTAWPEVAALKAGLPRALDRALASLGHRERPARDRHRRRRSRLAVRRRHPPGQSAGVGNPHPTDGPGCRRGLLARRHWRYHNAGSAGRRRDRRSPDTIIGAEAGTRSPSQARRTGAAANHCFHNTRSRTRTAGGHSPHGGGQ